MMRRQTENARIVQLFLRKPENTISVPNADAYSINTAMRSAEVTAYIMIKQTPSLNFFSGQIKASQSMNCTPNVRQNIRGDFMSKYSFEEKCEAVK